MVHYGRIEAVYFMDNPVARIREFVAFVRQHLTGDEKGEAQIFCERLFQAFGHAGVFEAGGNLEYRVHKGKTTRFADLLWRPRLLLEMKKSGEKLDSHYRQAFDYWLYLVPNRPQYVVLCNFDEFWIYDFNYQLDEPLDRVRLDDLPKRFDAFNFLFPTPKPPLFHNNQVAVTRKAADKVARLFNHLIGGRKSRCRPTRPSATSFNASSPCSPRESTCCRTASSATCCKSARTGKARSTSSAACSTRWRTPSPRKAAAFRT